MRISAARRVEGEADSDFWVMSHHQFAMEDILPVNDEGLEEMTRDDMKETLRDCMRLARSVVRFVKSTFLETYLPNSGRR